MAYEVWWALVLGFAISAIVQAWVPRHRIEGALSSGGAGSVAKATGLGAASSSCSYAAIAIGKSLFQKGASAASMLAFQFASTNLVWELGLVLWILIGWQFTLGEYVGGNSLDNTIRICRLVPTEWVLIDVRVDTVANGFGHGTVHLWAEDGTLLATASQSCIVREWKGAKRIVADAARERAAG